MAPPWVRLDTRLSSWSLLAQTPVALLPLAPCSMQHGVLFSSHPNGHSAKGTASIPFQDLVQDDVCRRLKRFRAARA
jgi:hypothetical protein